MDLGAFSISLPVADLERSRDFYATLGFEQVGGALDQGYLVLANGTTIVGVFNFEGMDFDAPMLTFNPGLMQERGQTDQFTDVREVARALQDAGTELVATPEEGTGPAHLIVLDPDGHRIMVDQFFDKPGS